MPRGSKRTIVPTARQKRTFRGVASFLGERGFVLFPIAVPFQRFKGYIALKKDSVMRLEPHPHAIVSELPEPLIIEKAPGGLVRVRPFKQSALYARLRSDLRRRFGHRVEFGSQVRLCQKTPWHRYLSQEHLEEWAAFARVHIEDESRAV